MSDLQNIHHLQEVHDHTNDQHSPWHKLKRIHHSWIFWIFVALMLAAIAFYIVSDGFSLVSHDHSRQPIESPVAP
jgi:phosphate/sulfate permease